MDRQQVEERICQIIVMEVVYITSLTLITPCLGKILHNLQYDLICQFKVNP